MLRHFFARYFYMDVLQIGRLWSGFSSGVENTVFVEDPGDKLVRIRFRLVLLRDVCLRVLVRTRWLLIWTIELCLPVLNKRTGSLHILGSFLNIGGMLYWNALRVVHQVSEGLLVFLQSAARLSYELIVIGKLKCGLICHLDVTLLVLV